MKRICPYCKQEYDRYLDRSQWGYKIGQKCYCSYSCLQKAKEQDKKRKAELRQQRHELKMRKTAEHVEELVKSGIDDVIEISELIGKPEYFVRRCIVCYSDTLKLKDNKVVIIHGQTVL